MLTIKAKDGKVISFPSYERKSYSGIMWNRFRGSIEIRYGDVSLLDGSKKTQFHVINTLPFKQYLYGLAEIDPSEHATKHRIMAMLTKTYALFYSNGKNVHPAIPAGSDYNAVDDARIFQKYGGYGVEESMPQRKAVIDSTYNDLLLYNDAIPIVPYFSCSAGFTW